MKEREIENELRVLLSTLPNSESLAPPTSTFFATTTGSSSCNSVEVDLSDIDKEVVE